MGDLKKKPNDFIMKNDDGEMFFVESMVTKKEEQTVKRLQTYIQKFYEEQLKKQEQNGGVEEDGQIQVIQKRDNGTSV